VLTLCAAELGGRLNCAGERDAQGHDPPVRVHAAVYYSPSSRGGRMYQQRVVTGLIVAVLIVLVLVILYEKLFA
jgi:hypothetical protein